MQARSLGAEAVAAEGGADAGDFVGRDGHADAGAADEDAALTFTAHDRVGDGLGILRIITGVFGIGAVVLVSESSPVKMRHQSLFQGETAVVTADCNHIYCLLEKIKLF